MRTIPKVFWALLVAAGALSVVAMNIWFGHGIEDPRARIEETRQKGKAIREAREAADIRARMAEVEARVARLQEARDKVREPITKAWKSLVEVNYEEKLTPTLWRQMGTGSLSNTWQGRSLRIRQPYLSCDTLDGRFAKKAVRSTPPSTLVKFGAGGLCEWRFNFDVDDQPDTNGPYLDVTAFVDRAGNTEHLLVSEWHWGFVPDSNTRQTTRRRVTNSTWLSTFERGPIERPVSRSAETWLGRTWLDNSEANQIGYRADCDRCPVGPPDEVTQFMTQQSYSRDEK
jgi:hypothetical protein